MRTIVMACKSITTEVEEFEVKVGLSSANQASLYEIKKRFSTELSNLLASAKVYSGGMGISPVSLVDAAAGNLTVTIVDLVKLLGMRPVRDNHSGGDGHPLKQTNVMKSKPMSFAMTPSQLSVKKEKNYFLRFSIMN